MAATEYQVTLMVRFQLRTADTMHILPAISGNTGVTRPHIPLALIIQEE